MLFSFLFINFSLNGQFVFFVWFTLLYWFIGFSKISSANLLSSFMFLSDYLLRFIPYLWQYRVTCCVPSWRMISPRGIQMLKPRCLPNWRTWEIRDSRQSNFICCRWMWMSFSRKFWLNRFRVTIWPRRDMFWLYTVTVKIDSYAISCWSCFRFTFFVSFGFLLTFFYFFGISDF